MVRSTTSTVAEYLQTISPEKRKAISTVRRCLRKNLPAGYVETMNWGMISYEVPLKKFPKTYNGQPLNLAALAAQKNYCSLNLMCLYQHSPEQSVWEEKLQTSGKKLNRGKSCLRFQSAGDLPLDVIGEIIANCTVEKLIAAHEAVRKQR